MTGLAGARPVPLARWIVRGALLFILAFANLHDIWSPDVIPNALVAWSLVHEGNVDLDEFVQKPVDRSDLARGLCCPPQLRPDAYFFRACAPARDARPAAYPSPAPRSPGGAPPPGPDEHVCSVFPPGTTLLALPALLPFALANGGPIDEPLLAVALRAGHLAAALIETIAALLLWSVVRRYVGGRWALGLVLLYWLGTSVRTVAAQALWQHAGVHLALAAALWLVFAERVTVRRELLAGLALGLGTVVRQTTAVLALGLARLPWPPVAAIRPLAPIAFAAGYAVGALPLLAYGQIAFGSAFEQGYGDKPFDAPIATGLYGLLFSPSRGLFIYEPWAVAVLVALALSWRRSGLVALRLRGVSIASVVLLWTYARYAEWWGGRVFGPRFLDDLAPAFIAALAWGISQGVLSRGWSRVAFWAAAAWSLLLFNAAALVYEPSGWDTLPVSVNDDPSRLLVWTDPQWLNVLMSVVRADERALLAALLSALIVALLLRLELRSGEADRREGG
jgi:hypothetical protein